MKMINQERSQIEKPDYSYKIIILTKSYINYIYLYVY